MSAPTSFDVALLASGQIQNVSDGTHRGDYQTVIFPRGTGRIVATRTRSSYAGARWSSWDVESLDRGPAGASINIEAVFGVRCTDGRKNRLNDPGTYVANWRGMSGTDSDWRYRDQQTEVKSFGFMIVSHPELVNVSARDIPKTVSGRAAKLFDATPTTREPETSEVAAWDDNTGTLPFSISRWDSGIYASRPQGAYTHSPFVNGATAPPPAGAKPAEKRTFDRTYERPNGQTYYGRSIDGLDDVDVIHKARDNGSNVLAYGPPGTGKTALFEAAFGDSLLTILGTAETEIGDFIGQYTQRPGEGYVWVDGPLVVAMEEGRPLLIDEIGLVDPKVMSIIYSVMDGRGELNVTQNPDRGTVHAADGFYIVAATNPDAPGVILSEALLSRFIIQVEIDSDYELARHLGVSKKVVRAAETLDKKRQAGEILWAPQLRELFAVKQNTDAFSESFALRSLIASAPNIDRDEVCNVLSKAFGETLAPLRMEG